VALGIKLIPLQSDSQGLKKTGKGRSRDFGRLCFLERTGRHDLFGVWMWLEEWRGGRLEWTSLGARKLEV